MAKARRNNTVKPVGTVRRNRPALMMSTALQTTVMLVLVLPAAAQPAPNAHPAGGAVVAGAAAISQTPSNTQITQSTQRAAIDWKSFDVGSQQSVTFSQPSASAVALNRVTGPDPSQIAGRIDANGQIILVNQSGVNFYKGAQVNAAGVMVSTIGASDQSVKSFVASASGRLALDQPGNPNAKVDNQGSITIKQAGLAALVAPQVANSGTITAKLGHVVLAGAKTATLDLYGDGLLSLDVTNQVAQTPVDKNNTSVTALVTNTGVIIADGGTVQLTARAADGIVQTLVQAGGTIRAATMGSHTGTVALNGVGGSIVVEGQLSAPGNAPGTSGGAIVANATGTVTLTPTAMLNASGRAGGGTVAVGTTLARAKGGPGVTPTLTAANVVVQKGATIAADATGKGTGGRVTVLSAGTTTLAGAISAKGGPAGGDGGFVETSGHTLTLGSSATVDTQAPHGLTGLWLLDPTDWNIAITGGNETPAQVVTGLRTSNVTITADNDVTVTDAINATTDALATNSLIFQAGRSILVNASITMNGGNFTATANDSADLGTALADRGTGVGAFTMAAGVTIDTSVAAKSISITVGPSVANTGGGGNFDPGTIALVNLTTGGGTVAANGGTALVLTGPVNAGAGTVTFAPNGPISQTAAGVITAATLTGSSSGGVDLSTATNAISAIGAFAPGGNFNLDDGTTPLQFTGALTGAGDTLTLKAGPISQTAAGVITAATLTGSSSGGVDLSTATNAISAIGAFAPGGNFNLDDGTTPLQFTGAFTGAGDTLTLKAGPISQTAAGVITAATLTASSTGGSVTLANPLNAVASVAGTATNGFTLDDFAAPLLTAKTIGATTVSLKAPVISIAGAITGTTSVGLTATAGDVAETGAGVILGDGALTASSTGGSVTLANPLNAVASVAGTATNGFTLDDSAAPLLTVNTIGAATVSLKAPVISIAGAITGTTSVGLTATAGDVAETGAGVILGDGALTASSTGGSVTLANPLNAVASVTGTATNGFTLFDGSSLTVAGAVMAGAGQTIALRTDNLTIAAGLVATGGTVAIAPVTPSRAMSLDGLRNAATLSLLPGDLSNVSTGSSGTLALGSVDGGATLLAGSLAINVPISIGSPIAGTLGLYAAGPISEPGGLAVATLTGKAAGTVGLTGNNDIVALGVSPAAPFSAVGQSFTLLDAGAVSLTVNGLTAGAVSLTAPAISIAGAITGTTSVGLTATAGDVAETGAGVILGDGALTATSTGGSVTLANPLNMVASVAGSATNGFTLDDSAAPTLTANTIGAATVSLKAPVISVAGAITGTTSVGLTATAGDVAETGAGVILGDGALTATSSGGSVTLGNPLNAVASVAGSATNGFTLFDGSSLTVAGAVMAGPGQTIILRTDNLTIAAGLIATGGTVAIAPVTPLRAMSLDAARNPATLSLLPGDLSNVTTGPSGTLALGSVDGGATLLAGSLAINVPISIGSPVAGTLGLYAAGPISEPGGLAVATLTGKATGTVGLTGNNDIVALGVSPAAPFSAVGQSFTLLDAGAVSLTVNGLTAGAVSLTAPAISIAGAITGTTSVGLTATAGDVAETGAGVILGDGALTATSTGGSVTLANPLNAVASVAGSATNGFTLDDSAAPTLTADTIGAATVSLKAPVISVAGAITGTTSVGLTATAGDVAETGAGVILGDGALTATSSGGSVTLGNPLNAVASVAGSATNGFTLDDSAAPLLTANTIGAATVSLKAPVISVAGAITGTTSVGLTATAGDVAETGAGVILGDSALTAASTGGSVTLGNPLNAVASVAGSATNGFTLDDFAAPTLTADTIGAATVSLTAPAISIAGAITGTTSVGLTATAGNVAETGAGVILGDSALTAASTGGSVTLANPLNAVASVAGSATNGFTLDDFAAPTLTADTIGAATVSLTAPVISIAGAITGTTSVGLTATAGDVAETGAGVILGDSALTATSSGGSVTLGNPLNAVASVAGSATNGFTLDDFAAPTLTANTIGAATVSLKAPVISVAGAITGTTSVGLTATAGDVAETGAGVILGDSALTAASSGGSVTLGNPLNAVASVAGSATNGFTLDDSAAPLLTADTIGAATVSLKAPVISVAGAITGTTSVGLTATAGDVAETGAGVILGDSALTAASTGGSVTLGNPLNAVASVAGSATNGFTLDDSAAPTLTADTIGAATVSLTAPVISIAGAITGTTSVGLTATAGDVAETGAGVILGDSALTATSSGGSVTLGNPLNAVASVAGSATNGFTLDDFAAPTLTANTIGAATVSLKAPVISVAGAITGTTSVGLTATAGDVAETGAGVILGDSALTAASTGGSVTLGNPLNAVASVAGSATNGFTLDDFAAPTLTADTIGAATVSLTAPVISIAGAITGTTSVGLTATAGDVAETGAGVILGDGALTATSTGGSVTLGNPLNAVASVAGSATNGFTLDDFAAPLLTADTIGAATVSLKAPVISVAGAITGTTSVGLTATAGDVAETSAGVILGDSALTATSSGGSVTLGNPLNAVTSVAGTATNGFTLDDSAAPTLTANTIGAATVSLKAPVISVAGAITGTTSVGLTATAGDVAETGAGVILGDSALTAASSGGSVTLGNPLNAVASVAGSATNGFTLDDSAAPLLTADTIGAATVSLKAPVISVAGAITGTTSVGLTATGGGISEVGSITTPLLTGSAATSASLTQPVNLVGTLGAFSTSAGFALTDNQALLVNGPVTDTGAASTLALTTKTGGISLAGTVSAANAVDLVSAGAISQSGGTLIAATLTGSATTSASLTQPVNLVGTLGAFSTTAGFALTDNQALLVNGPVADTGVASTLALTTKTGDITLAGTVSATNIVDLISAGAISQAGGILIAGTLTGSAATAASLAQRVNQIGALNGFTATGFTLDDAIGLTVLGTVSGGPSAAIVDKGPLAIDGTVTATAVSLTADSITIPGNVTGTTVALFGTVGAIGETGVLNAGTLTGSAVTTAAVTGTSFSNSIGTLNGFTAAGFTLDNGIGLTVLGTVSGGPNATIADKGPLAINGTVTATAVNLTADSIAIPGDVTANTMALFGTVGGIGETGVLNAGTLTGSAVTTANLIGTSFSNQIGTVSNFTASGFALNNGADLTITGILNGGPSVNLVDARTITVATGGAITGNTISATANGNFSIPGTVQGATSVNLVSTTGSITETGTLIANLLTGSAAGDASLTGASASNAVVQLGSFASGGTFTLDNGVGLTINGPLTAPTIIIDTGANALMLADKAVITTGGTPRPAGTITSFPGDTPATTTNGAFLTTSSGFTQQGSSTILGFGGGPSILRINANRDANITFDPVAGLQGANTWLILNIGTGKASGQIHVKNLDVIHNNQTGSANLNGTVTGLSGPAAAGVSGIQPNPNANFRINSCPIGSVNCVLLPTQGVPTANPLNDINIGTLFNPNDDDDLLLPIVSDQDY